MSHRGHTHHGGVGGTRQYKDSYASTNMPGMSSKRYHSPGGSSRSSGNYYDSSKRLRSEVYGSSSGGSFHTSSLSSARYSDSGSGAFSNRYKPSSSSSYYPSESSGYKSRYDDYKTSSSRPMTKSTVRRVPPPPQLSSRSSISSGRRPPPLMKVNISGGSYDGSRPRMAPPEYHSHSSFSSSSFRKPDPPFKRSSGAARPILRNPYGPVNSGKATEGSAMRIGTVRAAAAVSTKIRKRAAEERRKRIESSLPSSKSRSRRPKASEESSITKESSPMASTSPKDKDKETNVEMIAPEDLVKVKEELEMADGQVGVVLDEVGGDSEEEEIANNNNEKNEEKGEEGVKEKSREEGHDRDHDRDHDRGESPSSAGRNTLLKLYCKYCDSRSVTFRDYSQHLRSHGHTRAMNNSVLDMRKDLSKLRNLQRDEQRKAEKEEKAALTEVTSYCRVCELNFRTDPKEHEANQLHNDIKRLIYQRCEICNIDFRIWKVYLYHMAALEHVKRVAMKELKESEGKEDAVKGTNLSQGELGTDLVEIRTVFFCNACVRYLPIKGDVDEAKQRHCMTLTHVKEVEEFRQREKKIVERQRIRMEREEAERKLKEDKMKEEIEKQVEIKPEDGEEIIEKSVEEKDITGHENKEIEHQEGQEEIDEDEIELHAGDDVPDDVDAEEAPTWSKRTTRSNAAKSGN